MPRDGAFQEKYQRIAQACAKRMVQQNWRDRRRTIETTIQLVHLDMGSLAVSTMVACILEQLDAATVIDNDQALIYAMSGSADHQASACDWFIAQSLHTLATPTPRAHANGAHGATIH